MTDSERFEIDHANLVPSVFGRDIFWTTVDSILQDVQLGYRYRQYVRQKKDNNIFDLLYHARY
jgi:hypothetical protein